MTIPDEAYHAALNAFAEADSHEDALMKALTAAAPYMRDAARSQELEEAAGVAGNFLMLKTGLHVDKIVELEAALRALSSPDHIADAPHPSGGDRHGE